MTGGARRGERHQNVKALSIRDYFRRRLTRFKLGAHFLDLRCLLFELRSENLHLFLLQGDSRFQVGNTGLLFLDLFVLFEEFVEQHHVHRIVAHAVDLADLVTHNQVRRPLPAVSMLLAANRLKTHLVEIVDLYQGIACSAIDSADDRGICPCG